MGKGLNPTAVWTNVLASVTKVLKDHPIGSALGTTVGSAYTINAFDPNFNPLDASAATYFSIHTVTRGESESVGLGNCASGISKAWLKHPTFHIYAATYKDEADPYFSELCNMGNLLENAYTDRFGWPLYDYAGSGMAVVDGVRIRLEGFNCEVGEPLEDPPDSGLYKLIYSLRVKYLRFIGG